MTSTWRAQRDAVARAMADAGLAAPLAEARWIVIEATGAGEDTDEPVSPRAAQRIEEMLRRRLEGEPLQYVLGSWSFRGLDLLVDPRVLVPRPETEVTAQVAIDEAARLGARRGRPDPWTGTVTDCVVADLGTGSGAIALALAAELPDAEVWATDVSVDALAVARANLAGAGTSATRVHLAEGDWFEALPAGLRGALRVVVANPPYVAEPEVDDLPPEVARHEPRVALVSGPTGLEAIERLVTDAPAWLQPGGTLVLEIAPHQAEAATERARVAGFAAVRTERDLTGRDRVLVARLASSGREPEVGQ